MLYNLYDFIFFVGSLMDFNDGYASSHVHSKQYDYGLRDYMVSTFGYMSAALGLTGLVAFFVAINPSLVQAIFGNGVLSFIVLLAPLGFVITFSAGIDRMSLGTARILFWSYAAVMGLSLAPIFLVYTGESIARTFFISASMFAIMALYGQSTNKDLTNLGAFLMMGVIGIVVASIINIFIQSSAIGFAVSVIGVVAFTGLTAYDTQKLKQQYYYLKQSSGHDSTVLAKYSIRGALTLYLDFINLFILLLQLTANRRD